MSAQRPPDLNPSITLVSKNNRFRFILYFATATLLATAFSAFPGELLLELLSRAYPRDLLPTPLGILDILLWRDRLQVSQEEVSWFDIFPTLVIQTVLGAFTGVLQWIVLRQYLPKSHWIWATILGYQLGGLLVFNPSNPAIYYALVCQGLFQWLILRQVVRGSWIWLLTYPLASLVGTSFVLLLTQDLASNTNLVIYGYTASLPAIQAIVFCTFHPKSSQTSSE